MVIGLPLDHSAKTDQSGITTGPGQGLRSQGNLKGPGNPNHIHAARLDTQAAESIQGAIHQCVDHQ